MRSNSPRRTSTPMPRADVRYLLRLPRWLIALAWSVASVVALMTYVLIAAVMWVCWHGGCP